MMRDTALPTLVFVYVPSTLVAPFGAVYTYYPGGAVDCRILYVED